MMAAAAFTAQTVPSRTDHNRIVRMDRMPAPPPMMSADPSTFTPMTPTTAKVAPAAAQRAQAPAATQARVGVPAPAAAPPGSEYQQQQVGSGLHPARKPMPTGRPAKMMGVGG